MKTKILYLFMTILVISSCGGGGDDILLDQGQGNQGNNNENPVETDTFPEWLIPISEVKDGGPGKDGIPSIDAPTFLNASDSGASFLLDEDLVIGVVIGDEIRAYPHKILNWHEIVNDKINNDFVTINYCPLTGTSFGWSSNVEGARTTFGVSGLLYNTNLILYDRKTGSNWSQLKLQCVNGTLNGDEPLLVNVVETNWKTWSTLYPNTKILSKETGFSRRYDKYPYGDYKTNQSFFIFTPSPLNNALPNKDRIYAIMDENMAKVYQFNKFNGGKAIKDSFNGKEYLVVGNENIINSFELIGDQTSLIFEFSFTNGERFFKDNEGNKWSVFGKALEGPRTGDVLKTSKSVVSFWFAIAAFYPNPEIYN
jgi:hypothetical protein